MPSHRLYQVSIQSMRTASTSAGPVNALSRSCFPLQCPEEALCGSVVPTLTTPAHGLNDAPLPKEPAQFTRGVLASLIGMEHKLPSNIRPCDQRLREGRYHQRSIRLVRNRPADHFSRIQIQHHRQIDPSGLGPNVGDVARPNPVRAGGEKFRLSRCLHTLGSLAFLRME